MQNNFFLLSIAIVFLTSSLLFNPNIFSYSQENKTLYDNQQILNIYLLSKVFEKEIEKISNVVELVDNSPDFQILKYKSIPQQYMNTSHGIPENEELEKRSIFKSVMEINPSVSGLFFLLPNGDMYVEEPYSYQLNLTKTNFSFRDYYQGALQTEKMYMGDIIISAASGIPIVVVAVPIYSQNGNNSSQETVNNNTLMGILGVDVNFKTFDHFLKSLPLSSSNERVVFLDATGNKIADSSKSKFINQTSLFLSLSSFKRAINGMSGSMIEEFDNKTRMEISYAPVNSIQNTWVLLWFKSSDSNQ